MSKKDQLANQLSTFNTQLKTNTPIKVKANESKEIEQKEEESDWKNDGNVQKKGTNKFKTGELQQTTILIPKELRKVLKRYAFDHDMKVNTVIIDAIEKHILEK